MTFQVTRLDEMIKEVGVDKEVQELSSVTLQLKNSEVKSQQSTLYSAFPLMIKPHAESISSVLSGS